MIRGFAVLIVLLAFLPAAIADSYEISIQPDNAAIATAVIEGRGLHALELPKDAVPEVKGALYLTDGNLLTVSIGSTENAVVSYKTDSYVKETNAGWKFSIDLGSPVKVILPNDAEVISISPKPSADEADAKSFEFKGNEKIEIIYSLPEQKDDFSGVISYSAFAALTILILASGVLIATKIKKVKLDF